MTRAIPTDVALPSAHQGVWKSWTKRPQRAPSLRQEWLEDKDRTAMLFVELNGETQRVRKPPESTD